MLCRDLSLVKRFPTQWTVKPLCCKSWGCDHCAPGRIAGLKRLARSGKPNRFLTLTIRHTPDENPGEVAQKLKRAFTLLLKRAERQIGLKTREYLAIFEAHPSSGFPHLHILMRSKFISIQWIRDQLTDLIDSPVQDIRQVTDPGRAAYYITKYITKAPHPFEGCKRYWCSRNYAVEKDTWEPPCFDRIGTWERVNLRAQSIVYDKLLAGWEASYVLGAWLLFPRGPPGSRRTRC